MSVLYKSTFLPDLIVLLTGADASASLSTPLIYGTNLFKGAKARLPVLNPTGQDGPFVSLIRYGGQGAEGTHNSTNVPAYERPLGQVLVRAKNGDDAETLALELHAFLFPIRNLFINGCWWRELNVLTEVGELAPDDNTRARHAFNIRGVKRVSPSQS